MQLLDQVDPNPDNMVCAGIIHTQSQQVGCLLRLEPNKQAQVSYRSVYISNYVSYIVCLSSFLFLDVPINHSRQQGDGHS